ncbi:MAG TPA: GSCFA domain-containing protein [Chryseolinea sp.]|nr:GSCFA domain-containing protein [Chryseolinea sp.]
MSDFRTIVNTPRSPLRMAVSDRIFTIGSCFSDAIGERLANYKLGTYPNPAGILYNPVSIHRVLNLAMQGDAPSEANYTAGEVIFHHDFHSSLFAASKGGLQKILQQVMSDCQGYLQQSTWLIITYGTAWVYRRGDNGGIVANCHKQPSSGFVKSLLSHGDVEASFRDFYDTLRAFNPELKVILTISPVRHMKDTLEGNSVSKSVLRVACENITREHQRVFYFPAFEIMMDDLRDYRFYRPDMIHPNEVAEAYIWEKFAGTWFDDQLLAFITSWKSIRQALQHRPFHPGTAAHRQFLTTILERISAWSAFVNTEAERDQVMAQLIETDGVPRE